MKLFVQEDILMFMENQSATKNNWLAEKSITAAQAVGYLIERDDAENAAEMER